MRGWIGLLACILLSACAAVPPAPPSDLGALLHDAAFAAPSEPIDADEVFALSDEMRRYIGAELAEPLHHRDRRRRLIGALYGQGRLKLDYDTSTTRTASQAFAARSGNCLSLVLMTAALAKALDLRVEYQSAYTEETWSRSGDLYLRSGHVNITLGRRFIDQGAEGDAASLTIDFLPAEEIRGLRTQAIGERTVVAMFMNNRAAEALAAGRLDDAYWWAREAVLQSPVFLSAYNTLGVVYARHGEQAQADRVLSHVLDREPANTQALANRAQLLTRLGRVEEAAALQRRLAQVEPYPPFHFFDLGRAAMTRGDYRAARELFVREVDRASYNAEFQYWLGLAEFRLGDADAASRQLARALENSVTRGERDLYAAKLAWLRTRQRQ